MRRTTLTSCWLPALGLLAACGNGGELVVDPETYVAALGQLRPGDTMRFMAGTYQDCLEIDGLHGTDAAKITMTGPESGPPAILIGANCMPHPRGFPAAMIRLQDASHLVFRHFELDGQSMEVVGLQAGYGTPPVHNITVEDLYIHDNDVTSQFTGISVFTTSWDWVIRNNHLERVGLGLYLGNSDGSDPFIRGVIEHNLVVNPKGYGMQIKHQFPRVNVTGMPQTDSVTYIRHNVFIKAANSVTGNLARPNLLLGDLPPRGIGSGDRYEVYGNFLFQNDSNSEGLFQGEGNYAFHDNVLFNSFSGPGVLAQPHNGLPRDIAIYRNTIVTAGMGVIVTGGDTTERQIVQGNAVYAGSMPISADDTDGNVTGRMSDAASVFNDPSPTLGQLDLHPRTGELLGGMLDYSAFSGHADFDRDFNGNPVDPRRRGAYATDGMNPGWALAQANKPRAGGPAPPPDGGVRDDASVTPGPDAGAPPAPDAGTAPPAPDAGVIGGADAGVTPSVDAGQRDATGSRPPPSGGGGSGGRASTSGGCSASGPVDAQAPGGLFALVALAWVCRRRSVTRSR